MRDIDLYRHILGLESPWTVEDVKLSVKDLRVDISVTHGERIRWPCPDCQTELPLYDHADPRSWRHLDSCQFQTFLHARPPRVECPQHGVKQVILPWAEARSRFTALFERLAIDIMLETDITGAAKIIDITWDEAWAIQERAVARGLKAKVQTIPRRIGVDEKSAAKGHRYLTLVCNLDEGNVEYIADERKTESLDGYFASLTPAQRNGIEAVAMDMWDPFFNSVKKNVPDAEEKIVFDKFHIMQHVGEAVDKVRRVEHKQLSEEGNNILAKSKYIWLYRQENLPEWHEDRFKELQAANLKTGVAWAMKECLVDFFNFKSKAYAKKYFDKWFWWATHSKLKPMAKVAHMIKRHLSNVLTFFTHRITNAVCEGLNSKIQTIKKMAYGFRNMEHLKTAIYFHCGGLSLYPATHSKP